MNVGRRMVALGAILALGFIGFTGHGRADGTAQTLPFSQNWTNTGLITANDNWSGVPGIEGYLGDGLTGASGTDPQTILAFGTGTIDVIANQTNTAITNGGVAEFEIANPVVALQGSGGASAPFLLLHLNTTGVSSVQVSYNLRDIDATTDNAIQPVALQFRVGNTGNFTNVPAGFVADATTGPSLATLVTPVSVILPAAASNQPEVQVRIITANAVGNDEWVGIDDINVTAAAVGPSGSGNASPNNPFAGDTTLLTVATQQGTPPSAITGVVGDLTAIGAGGAQAFFDDGSHGDVTAGDGTYSFLATVDIATTAGAKVLPTTVTDALNRTGSAPISLTVQSNSTAPSGVGAANPSTVPPGGGTLLTVSVTPGANPPSTGLAVVGNLTAIGGSGTQPFFDDGTNGDVTPGDNVFSFAAVVDGATPVGGKSLPILISDAQSRSGSATISLIVGDVVPPVVISQVFGGGGEAGAPFHNDFVELFNRGASPADLSTWSLQYTSATGTTWEVLPLSGILQPGKYYLVQLGTAGGGGAALPAPDATGTTSVDFAAGKLLLASSATPATGSCPSAQVVDLVGYGAADCFEGAGPAPAGTASTADARLLKGCADNNNNAADFALDAPTPRNGSTAALDCSQQQPPAATLRAIDQVQGSGSTSPFAGQVVRVRGVVTGRTSNTFFLQTPDGAAEADGDPATSEGVAIFVNAPPTVNSGDFVEVTGTVSEFIPNADLNSPPKTEILPAAVTLFSSGNPLPAPVEITAGDTSPGGSIEQLEKYEGMRVSVASLTTVSPTDGNVNEPNATSTSTGVFYGVVTGVARPFREPGIEVPDPLPPGAPANIPRFDANPERLRVDSDLQTGAAILNVSAGAVVTNLVGPLDYSFRTYTIAPDPATPPTVTGGGAATPVPLPGVNQFTVASFNMERFFDTVNDPGISEPVLTTTAFNNRLNKASLTIRNILRTPDILGVQEMENLSTLTALANKINNDAVAAGDPSPSYTPFLVEGNDVGGIDVGFLVKSTKVGVVDVTQYGKDATYIDPTSGNPALLNDRPSLVLRALVHRLSGPDFPLTVIVNHLRSLSGVDDPVDGNRVRTKRRAQAEFLADLIQARQVADPNERIISVGDYNAFGFNDGYVDSMGTITGLPTPADQVTLASPDLVNPDLTNLTSLVAPDQRYSFTFDGNAQELDHALVTQNLLGLVASAARARVNADFPEIFRNDSSRPERLSDHDPLVAYIRLPATTTTSLVSSVNPSTFGQPVTFTAAVTAGATAVTTGTVTFRDGTTVLATVDLNASGQAAFTTSTLGGGDHAISASFNGTAGFDASAAALTQTVNAAPTTTAVASSANPSGQGQPVTFTATVTRSGTPVTAGSVTFFEGAVVLAGPFTVDAGGQAAFTTSTLGVGSHTIRADYAGTPSFAASSGSVVQSVQPGLVVSDVSVVEGNVPNTVAALFTLTLSSPAAQLVSVSYATQNGTATAGADYEARTGVVNFPPGVTQRKVAVVIVSDTEVEPDETFSLSLSSSTNAVIVDPTGAGTIVNDDNGPSLSVNDVTVREKEGGAGAVFTVTLSNSSSQTVTVAYETADGTATEPADYAARAGTLTFPPGTLTQTITVPVVGDNVPEPRETFYVVLSAPANATVADGLGIGTIVSGPFLLSGGAARQ